MTIRFATEQEIAHWNEHILANPDGGNIFQGAEFADQKALAGWKTRYIIAKPYAITILEKTIVGFGKVWYAPKGPATTSDKELIDLLPSLKHFARSHGVFTIKIEPEILLSDDANSLLSHQGLLSTRPIQPNFATVLMDLSPDLDTILTAMPQKGRHAIKRAERDGVTAEAVPATDENCQIMYDLYRETALAAGFGYRSAEYYRTYYQRYAAAGIGQLFFAYVDSKIVAGAYALAFGEKGTYKDGASLRQRTTYGSSHLLQWRVIEWLKQKGVTLHDLCGAPPADQLKNPEHPHYGLARFKLNFSKQHVEYVGAYEIPVRPLRAKLWSRIIEKAVRRLYYKLYKESYY